MIEPLLELAPNVLSRLAERLETGELRLPTTAIAVSAAIGREIPDNALETLNEMHNLGATSVTAASWIRSLQAASARRNLPELVWSGPEAKGVHTRQTRQVFEGLIDHAEHSVWISTYAYFNGPEAFKRLAQRMDAAPGLSVHILMNLSPDMREDGTPTERVSRFARQFWNRDWPGQRRPSVFYDPRSLEPDQNAVLHAKALVCDHQHILITSANLTESAFDRNYELGLLVHDEALARAAASQFQTLVDLDLLIPLPSG